MVDRIGGKLTQNEIEEGISAIFKEPFPQRLPIRELISEKHLIKFLIYGTELLRREPMLVEFEFNDRCTVVGDIHGNINDLIGVVYETGIPPRSNFLFLGDFVGRGDCQLDVFVAVLLLKLRWPTYVYMLRGNHECTDQSEDDGFERACMDAYNNEEIYRLFGQLFDFMPVAAIVNNQALCCHGGISQWMISRDAIRSIPRPTYLKDMKVLENCLLTDIMWADPDTEQKIPFAPSPRGVSYTFNEEALSEVFFYLRCNLLIRGHKWVEGGILEEIKDKCYTVHTTAMLDIQLAPAYIILRLEQRKVDQVRKVIVDISRNTMHSFSADYSDSIWTEILSNFLLRAYTKNPVTYLEDFNHEEILQYLNPPEADQPHNLSHVQMTRWTLANAPNAFKAIKTAQTEMKFLLSAESFPQFFPSIYDIVHANGSTYRVRLSAEEKEFLKKVLKTDSIPSNPLPLESWPDEYYDLEEGSEISVPG